MTNLSAVEVITACQDGDVVFLDWPDGAETMVKGRELLERIIKTGKGEEATFFRIPVSSDPEAEVIAAAISVIEDGDFHLGAEATFIRLLDQARGPDARPRRP